MPSIVEVPAITRTNSRGMKQEEAQEYVDLLSQADAGSGVQADGESKTAGGAYGRGERVRNAIDKFDLLPKERIRIRTVELEDEKWVAVLVLKAEKDEKDEKESK